MATAGDSAKVAEILTAAADHDTVTLEKLLKRCEFGSCNAVDAQNEKGTCPLHAAIASCEQAQDADKVGESQNDDKVERAACDTVRFLLENGAIWNQLDDNDETPACIAYRLGKHKIYGLMVDAGVRAEILLNRLETYDILADEEEQVVEQDEDEDDEDQSDGEDDRVQSEVEQNGSLEIVDGSQRTGTDNDVSSTAYLSSALAFTDSKLLDSDQNGVMMSWESDIMQQSANSLLTSPNLKILNIGAGMLIFDTYVQQHTNTPASHHIIEAHPDVLLKMRREGWYDSPGVIIHEGRWQDVLPDLVARNVTFDAIYHDTFAERYMDFKDFFAEYVLALLEQDGRWSFFNGMGADRQVSYDVYQKVVEMDLFEAGFDVEWIEIGVPRLEKEWEGVKRSYWNVEKYRLPVCKFMD